MVPAAPISPEEGSRPDVERMQEHTHLARLFGGTALPLTLFAQGTEATTADAGRVDHAQTPISFPMPTRPRVSETPRRSTLSRWPWAASLARPWRTPCRSSPPTTAP